MLHIKHTNIQSCTATLTSVHEDKYSQYLCRTFFVQIKEARSIGMDLAMIKAAILKDDIYIQSFMVDKSVSEVEAFRMVFFLGNKYLM